MPTPTPPTQIERQVNLLLALDRARDALIAETNPTSMYSQIAEELKQIFAADACAIMVLAPDANHIEHIATTGINSLIAVDLCYRAMGLAQPGPVQSDRWSYTLGLQIHHEEYDQALGSVLLARDASPFSDQDAMLLAIAESQIDSAVFQVRRTMQLMQRNRELEAVFRIDQLRDDTTDETALVNGFLTLLGTELNADLVMIMLRRMDDDEHTLRGMLDRTDLSPNALKAIRAMAEGVTEPRVIGSPPEISHLRLLCAPLFIRNERLGSLIIGRGNAFGPGDHSLLQAMVTQIDSAIAHSRTMQELQQRNQELETIYRIDQIRDNDRDLDEMLQDVLQELCQVVHSEMGYLMLFSEDDERNLEIRATTREDLFTLDYKPVIESTSRQALEQGQTITANALGDRVRSIVAVPLILNDRVIGVFGAINRLNATGFTPSDQRLLQAITSQVDTAVFERLERRRMRRLLSRSVDPKVLEKMLKRADANLLAGERVVLTALFADLRGSTEWTERTEPEALVSTLNRFLGSMTEVIFRHGGTLDKFVGDEVIALFGAPVHMDDHAIKAIQAAHEMQRIHQALIDEISAAGGELPTMGIGVSSGEVIAGEMGPPVRTDFTAIGRVMNLGARLCAAADGGQVLISKDTYELLESDAEVRPLRGMELKGLGDVDAYELLHVSDGI